MAFAIMPFKLSGVVELSGPHRLLLCFLLALLSFASFPSHIHQLGSIDPYVYTALIKDYDDVVQRYGPTYYSFRTSFIFPLKLLYEVFGDVQGYALARILMLFFACAAVSAIAKRFYGSAVAIAAIAWVAFNPWLVRSLLYDHYDGGATVYCLIAAGFLFGTERRPVLAHLAAGAAIGSAASANPVPPTVFLSLLPLWFLVQTDLNIRTMTARMAAFVIACLLTLLGWILVQAAFLPSGLWSGTRTTLDVGRWLLEGGAARWFAPIWPSVRDGNYEILVPPALASFLVLVILLAGRSLSRPRFACGALLALTIGIVIYLVFHFILKFGAITTFYYYIYLFPLACIAAIAALGEIGMLVPEGRRAAVPLGFSLLLVGTWLLTPLLRDLIARAGPLLVVLTILLATGYAAFARRPAIAAGFGVAFIVCLPLLVAHSFMSRGALSHPLMLNPYAPDTQAQERGFYDGAVAFQRFIVKDVPPDVGDVGFWYGTTERDKALDSVQSMFLWGYSRGAPPGQPGMPAVYPALLESLSRFRYLALLGWTKDDVDAGLSALAKVGIRSRWVDSFTFDRGPVHFEVVLIEQFGGPVPPVNEIANLPLDGLKPLAKDALFSGAGRKVIDVAAGQWAYLAELPLPPELLTEGRLIRIRAMVSKGSIGASVADRSNPSDIFDERTIHMSSEPLEVLVNPRPFLAATVHDAPILILRSTATTPVHAEIETISIVEPAVDARRWPQARVGLPVWRHWK